MSTSIEPPDGVVIGRPQHTDPVETRAVRENAVTGRVLAINNYHFRKGGAEVVYLNGIDVLEAAGWEVAAFAMKHPSNEPTPWASWFADEVDLRGRYGLFEKAGKAIDAIWSTDAARRVRRLIETFRPDVVHAHNIYHHLSPSVLAAAKKSGVPVVLTLHDLKLLCPAYTMMREGRICEACKDGRVRQVVQNRCMKGSTALSAVVMVETSLHRALDVYRRSVDRFVVPSRFMMSKFKEWGWSLDRFVHVPNFVEIPDGPLPVPGEAFLFLGRLTREKGVETLLRAAAATGLPVWIVGTGPDEAALQALAQDLGVEARFLGFQTGEGLWRLLRECRAVVVPSEAYENAPISILEALAYGKPVIGSRIGGLPEMVEPGVTGELFQPGDVEELAARMRVLAGMSKARLSSVAVACRRVVVERYSARAYVRNIESVYGELLDERRGRAGASE